MKEKWLEKGYEHFAEYGPDKLSVNQLSNQLNTSRASFYHYFGDIDIFIDELLAIHWSISQDFNEQGAEICQNFIPDLYHLLSQYPIALRFSRQLFQYRYVPKYNMVYIKTYESSAYAFLLKLFAAHLGIDRPKDEVYSLWLTLGEAWYSRLNPEDLSQQSMQNIAEDVLDSLSSLINSDMYAIIK